MSSYAWITLRDTSNPRRIVRAPKSRATLPSRAPGSRAGREGAAGSPQRGAVKRGPTQSRQLQRGAKATTREPGHRPPGSRPKPSFLQTYLQALGRKLCSASIKQMFNHAPSPFNMDSNTFTLAFLSSLQRLYLQQPLPEFEGSLERARQHLRRKDTDRVSACLGQQQDELHLPSMMSS